jgi:amino acid transporter
VFWIFSAMAVQLYLIMYMMMFAAALKLRRTHPDVKRGFRTPAMGFFGGLGFLASLLAFFIGFVVPEGNGMNQVTYTLILVGGIVVLGIWPFVIYLFRKDSWKIYADEDHTHSDEEAGVADAAPQTKTAN